MRGGSKRPRYGIGNIYRVKSGIGGKNGEYPYNTEHARARKRTNRGSQRPAETLHHARTQLHKTEREIRNEH